MSKFSQFLMPDGRSLASVLKSDVDSQSDIFNNKRKQSKTTKRGKVQRPGTETWRTLGGVPHRQCGAAWSCQSCLTPA